MKNILWLCVFVRNVVGSDDSGSRIDPLDSTRVSIGGRTCHGGGAGGGVGGGYNCGGNWQQLLQQFQQIQQNQKCFYLKKCMECCNIKYATGASSSWALLDIDPMQGYNCMSKCHKNVLKGKTDKLRCDVSAIFGSSSDSSSYSSSAAEEDSDSEAKESDSDASGEAKEGDSDDSEETKEDGSDAAGEAKKDNTNNVPNGNQQNGPPPGMMHPTHPLPPPAKKSMFTTPVMIGIGAGVFLLFVVMMVVVSSRGDGGYRGHAYAGSAAARNQYYKGACLSHARREKSKHSSGGKTSHTFDATSHVLQRRDRSTNHSHTTDKVKSKTTLASKSTTRLASQGATKYNTASGKKSEKSKERMHKSSSKSRLSGKSSSALKLRSGSVKQNKKSSTTRKSSMGKH